MIIYAVLCILIAKVLAEIKLDTIPPYVKQCHEGDPKLIQCFIRALHHLSPYLATGIKDIDLPSVEPFRMDELSLSLTTGPNGYKVMLNDMDIYGASNYTVNKLKLSENGKPFEAKVHIPALRINSKYASSGVLIIIPASGNGSFHGRFGDITATVRGKISTHFKDGLKYLHVDTLLVDMDIKNINMGVKDVYRNNRIIGEAINLFLQQHGQEVLKVMTPQLRRKLSSLFQGIANQLLTHLPLQTFFVPASTD